MAPFLLLYPLLYSLLLYSLLHIELEDIEFFTQCSLHIDVLSHRSNAF